MDEKDIDIKGKDNKIEISDVEDIKIRGDDNVIRVEGEDKDIRIKGSKNIIDIKEEERISGKEIKREFKTKVGKTLNFFKQKKVINILIVALFLLILLSSVSIRTQNLPLLKDSTSGKTIPLALDPYYFLRIAETMISEGGLPEYDIMRYPALQVGFSSEILPFALVFLYKFMNIFGEYSLGLVNVISPVIFFALALIVFYFLIYFLTKSKLGALIGSAFLAFIPAFLYRTMAGFSDHEAIGIFAFFAVLLGYTFALKFLNKKNKSWRKTILYGLLVAFLTTFSIVSWGGGAAFIFLIIPLSFLIFWLINYKEEEIDIKSRGLVFYGIWVIFSVIFGLVFNYSMSAIFNRFLTSSSGIISLFVLLFIFVDYFLVLKKFKRIKEKFRILYSIGITILLGGVGLFIIGKNPFSLISSGWGSLLHPFGLGRVGLTVAENAQPYLLDWMSNVGKTLFWFFYLGSIFIGIEISKGIKRKSSKIFFALLWILMVSGILFSRISSGSLFNGINFLSQFFYLIGILLFSGYFIKIYLRERVNISPELILMSAWMFVMIISGRGAIRMFFAITPFVCFSASFFIIKIYNYYKQSKDDLMKLIFGIGTLVVILFTIVSLVGFFNSISAQAKYTGPSANQHWQSAMSWVRENTQEGSIFVHWWDYGYWVQYLGERPTVTDGGHANGYWDHLTGRYLLTTPYPETALSFMKTHNVSYLLIDPTDIGKYPAYSSIGSDKDNDRYSGIIAMINNPKNIQETSEGEIRIYQGSYGVEEDTFYDINGTEIFLPGPTYNKMNKPIFKSYIIGMVLEVRKEDGKIGFNQPEGVFVYNNNQYRIPLRYMYYNGELFDFKSGLESGIRIIPSIIQNSGGIQIDSLGAGLYLSDRTFNSLVGQLYLMDDVLERYEGVEIAHIESSPVVKSLKAQGKDVGEFVYFQGVQGPIKIWEINPTEDIKIKEEFLSTEGDWAEFDYLFE